MVELESGLHGEVRDINMRYTLIATNDNIDILVPNSEFITGRVVNWTHGERSRRLRIPFAVAYGSDKELVKRAALEAAAEVPFTLALDGPRRPQVWLVDFADSSLGFELVVWLTPDATKRPSAVKAAYLWALETALRRHGVEVPYPQRDLHLRSLFGLEREAALAALRGAEQPAGVEPAEGAAEVTRRERARLARNDAVEEVDRASREETARRAAEETPEVPERRQGRH
jgi:small-conductance mechanosensitive channel